MGDSEAPGPGRTRPGDDQMVTPMQVSIPALLIVRVALAIWLLALVVCWTVPALSTGDRSWWPWVPVAGIGVGLFGHTYVSRGRGHASGT